MSRAMAIGSLVSALALSIWAWQFLNRATDSGLERLSRIDAMRALCTAEWVKARTEVDSMRVDRFALPDTIDRDCWWWWSSQRLDSSPSVRALPTAG